MKRFLMLFMVVFTLSAMFVVVNDTKLSAFDLGGGEDTPTGESVDEAFALYVDTTMVEHNEPANEYIYFYVDIPLNAWGVDITVQADCDFIVKEITSADVTEWTYNGDANNEVFYYEHEGRRRAYLKVYLQEVSNITFTIDAIYQ